MSVHMSLPAGPCISHAIIAKHAIVSTRRTYPTTHACKQASPPTFRLKPSIHIPYARTKCGGSQRTESAVSCVPAYTMRGNKRFLFPLCDSSRCGLWMEIKKCGITTTSPHPHLVIDRLERDRTLTCPRALAFAKIEARELPCRVLMDMPR